MEKGSRETLSIMAADKSMKCYESIFERQTLCCYVPTDPVGSNAEVGAAVGVRPYVSCKRDLADSKLVSNVS